MTGAAGPAARQFHESPLVLFTTLVVIGAGLLAGHFTAWALAAASWTPNRWCAGTAVVLIASGIFLSLLHLGRPSRLAYALRRIGRSPLSTEVILAFLTLVPAAAALLLPALQGTLLWGIAAAASPGLLLALGWVYRLPGQLSWKGPALLAPLLLGLVIGLLAQAATNPGGARLMFAALLFLAADAAGFAIRWKTIQWDASVGEPVHPSLFGTRRRILILRFLDVTLIPLVLMLAQLPVPALGVLGLGVLVDRFAFYALALRRTPEAEISRIERHIKKSATNSTNSTKI